MCNACVTLCSCCMSDTPESTTQVYTGMKYHASKWTIVQDKARVSYAVIHTVMCNRVTVKNKCHA